MSEVHCSLEDLAALAAGERIGDPDGSKEKHVQYCPLCSGRYAQMQRIDDALRHLPIPAVGGTFTTMVLHRVARTAKTPLMFRLLEHGASVLGILLVVTVILSAYIMGEGFSGGRQSDGPIGQVVRESGELMSKAGGWLAQHSGSILGEGSGVFLMLCAAAGGVLLLIDRWLSSRMGHR